MLIQIPLASARRRLVPTRASLTRPAHVQGNHLNHSTYKDITKTHRKPFDVHIYLSLSLSLYIYIYMYTCTCLSLYRHISLSLYIYIYISISPSISPSLSIYVYIHVHVHVHVCSAARAPGLYIQYLVLYI